VKSAVQIIERGRSQVDLLNSLLEQCLEFGSRAALLILRGETFSGWKGIGFTAAGGNDENIKRFNAAPGLIPELDRLLREECVISWDGANLSTRFGVGASETAVLVPMVIKDKVAAAVYVDAVGDRVPKFDQAAIEVLVFTTGLLVDTLSIRKKIPSPSLTGESAPPEHPAFERTTTSGPAFASAPAAAPAPAAPAPPAPAPAAPATDIPMRTDAGTVAINAAQLREMMAAQRPTFNVPSAEDFGIGGAAPAQQPPRAPVQPPPAAKAPAPAPPAAAPEPPKPAAPATPAALGGDERPSTQYIPPAGLARGANAGPPSEETKKHDEARRFARLLVSEIKLYNESKVEQGRKNNDLYERLKEDIDRSRQMYDERISDDVRKVSNYFYDELVRILADGRADALGL
jgi:hypothetical protein